MRLRILVLALTAVCLVVSPGVAAPPPGPAAQAGESPQVLVLVSDGMRHDLMTQFVRQGLMPAYAEVLQTGVEGVHGMIPNVPPNTGPGWTGLATGASASVNGVTNNTFHDNTRPFVSWGVSAWDPGVNLAETLMQQAEEEGLSIAVLAWQAFDPATLVNGVAVESYPDWLTGRGIIANYDVPLQWTNILSPNYFMSKTVVTLADASGWVDVPASYSPPKETTMSVPSFYGPVLDYAVYIFDSSDDEQTNYDRVLISPTEDGDDAVAVLGADEWSGSVDVSVLSIAGGIYFKVVDLAPDLSQFRLYFTPATRYRAYPESLEEDLMARFDPVRPTDYSPFILGLIDEETFIEQHLYTAELLGQQVYPYIIETYQPDLVLAGNEATDSITHRFLALATPGTEVYEPGNASRYWQYIQSAYQSSDSMLRALWDEMPGANVIVTSDHGFTATWMAINANFILETLGFYIPGDLANSKAVAYVAGGTAQIYINLMGRNPGGVVPPEEYEAVRSQIVAAFEALGPDVIERVLLKEETAQIQTTAGIRINMLHPDRTGDVVVFSHPPYQFDAPTAGQVTSLTPIYGQHGYVPNGERDRYAVFAATGPQIRRGHVPRVTAFDLAPTIAALLGIDPPDQAEGEVLRILLHRLQPVP